MQRELVGAAMTLYPDESTVHWAIFLYKGGYYKLCSLITLASVDDKQFEKLSELESYYDELARPAGLKFRLCEMHQVGR